MKISFDIFHELAGERLGWAEYKLAARAACQQNYSSFIGELQDEKEKRTNLIERKIKKVRKSWIGTWELVNQEKCEVKLHLFRLLKLQLLNIKLFPLKVRIVFLAIVSLFDLN